MFKYSFPNGLYEVSHKKVENPDGNSYNNHVHSYCELLLFISGSAQFNIDGTIYSLRPYDLLFIPDTKYHYLIPNSESPYENYVIGFAGNLVSESLRKRIFSPPYVVNIRDSAELCGFFKRLDFYSNTYSEKDFVSSAFHLVSELLIYLAYFPKDISDHIPFRNKQVDDIIDIIDENITEKLDSKIIAGRLFLSKSYVQNVFSGVMHIGLKQYINQKKVFCADTDIRNGMSPAKAAEKYSFTDYSSFYRAYKKVFGISPGKKRL